MIFKATVSNKAHPEYGSATIPFPIPDSEYDRTIESLEAVGLASPIDQDCRVDMIESGYPILNRLCRTVAAIDSAQRAKLNAVVLMAQPEDAGEILQLAENLDQFDFIPGIKDPERNCQTTDLGLVAYHGTLTLDELMREDPAEQYQSEQQMGGMM